MAHPLSATAPTEFHDRAIVTEGPARQAFVILRLGFTVLPIIAGLDKFAGLLVNWDQYLSPRIASFLPVAPHTFMLAVGAIEIVAGLLVALRPKFGGIVVMLWLWGIVLNLLLHPDSFAANGTTWGLDIALRDFGLSLGALALSRLGAQFEGR